MTNNDARRDLPVSPLVTSEEYFTLADVYAEHNLMDEADKYWQLGVRRASEEASND